MFCIPASAAQYYGFITEKTYVLKTEKILFFIKFLSPEPKVRYHGNETFWEYRQTAAIRYQINGQPLSPVEEYTFATQYTRVAKGRTKGSHTPYELPHYMRLSWSTGSDKKGNYESWLHGPIVDYCHEISTDIANLKGENLTRVIFQEAGYQAQQRLWQHQEQQTFIEGKYLGQGNSFVRIRGFDGKEYEMQKADLSSADLHFLQQIESGDRSFEMRKY